MRKSIYMNNRLNDANKEYPSTYLTYIYTDFKMRIAVLPSGIKFFLQSFPLH